MSRRVTFTCGPQGVLWSAEANEGKGRVWALKGLSSNSSVILGVSRRA